MPIIKSAKKAARQAEKRTRHNVEIKKSIRAALKTFKANPTSENLSKVQSEYDKAVKKNLMEKNTAARRKAKLHQIAKAAGVKLAATAKKVAGTTEAKPETKVAKAKTAAKTAEAKPAAAKTAKAKTTKTAKTTAKKTAAKAAA